MIKALLKLSIFLFMVSACTQKNQADIEIHDVFEEAGIDYISTSKEYKAPSKLRDEGLGYYEVKGDDDIISISKKLNMDIADIIEINGLKAPYRIKSGQIIYIPKKEEIKVTSTSPEKQDKSTKTIRPALKKSSDKFIWPVKGSVISKFGPKSGGIFNSGININASSGTKVKATADGEVIYIGDSVKGFGKIIIIKHGEDWVSAYAHNKEILVNKGDHIAQGQIIAYVGKTGGVKTPQLHFALRKDGKSVNPLKYVSG